jgi:membrane-bound lytic murein transglycosylase MltF
MKRWLAFLQPLALILLLTAAIVVPGLADVPHAANRYRADLARQARLVWGLDAPVAVMAAQIHQESSWNPRALSPAGAQGMAQFMPATVTWIGDIDPALRGGDVYNPTWAFRAMARYDHWLYGRLAAATPCDRWAFTLSAYNGGLGWVLRDKNLAAAQGGDRNRWWGQVERHNAGRSAANWQENRGYPRRILVVLAPRYAQAGWGDPVCF